MKKDTILLIDDESHIISAIKRDIRKWIKEKDLEIASASSADEALDMLTKEGISPAVVICDQSMPGLTGIEFLRRFAVMFPQAVTIMLTAYGKDLDFPEIISVGVFSFINKPWDSKEFLGEVMKAYQVYSLRRANMQYSIQLKQEMQLAMEFQKFFLRYDIPKSDFFEIRVSSVVARGNELTGDYTDIIRLPDNKLVVLLGDVAGHGLKAAFLTAILKSIIYPEFFKKRLSQTFSPSLLLEWLNRRLFSLSLEDRGLFLAFLACYIDPENSTVTIANAGHPKPVFIGESGVLTFNEGNIVLGVQQNAVFKEATQPVRKGDKLVLITDGFDSSGLKNSDSFRNDFLEGILTLKASSDFHRDVHVYLEKLTGDSLGDDDGTLITISFF